MKLISQGAEAKIYDNKEFILKTRVSKKYRIAQIDDSLRKSRTRREAKVLQTLEKIGFPAPRLIDMDDKSMKIKMQKIKGEILRDVLEKDHKRYGKAIGEKIATMHNHDIIHGDLTTSNMIVNEEVYFIDLGLSFFSDKAEDKAVDLHLLRQALESKHYTVNEGCFEEVIKAYKKHAKDAITILTRFKKVEKRGRNKPKV